VKYTADQVRGMLERQCSDAGGQKAWADLHNVTPQHVSDVLLGRRGIGLAIAEALGLQSVTLYEPQRMAPREQFRRRTSGEQPR
jgi:DNA-binding transcriptional regulator YdaS (Cro superfamily)